MFCDVRNESATRIRRPTTHVEVETVDILFYHLHDFKKYNELCEVLSSQTTFVLMINDKPLNSRHICSVLTRRAVSRKNWFCSHSEREQHFLFILGI